MFYFCVLFLSIFIGDSYYVVMNKYGSKMFYL